MVFRWLCLLMAAAAAAAQTAGSVNIADREKEIALGDRIAAEVRRETAPVASPAVQEYVGRMGRRLASHAPGAAYPYRFEVVEHLPGMIAPHATPEPLALPGGILFVPAEAILQARNAAEFAGMLARGIAHVAAHDCSPAAAGPLAAGTWNVCGWMARGQSIPMGYVRTARSLELRADAVAVRMMAQSGFDPEALAAYIRRVQRPARGSLSQVFSPLPAVPERVAAIETEIGKVSRAGDGYPESADWPEVQRRLQQVLAK